jgi:hypothetical protein
MSTMTLEQVRDILRRWPARTIDNMRPHESQELADAIDAPLRLSRGEGGGVRRYRFDPYGMREDEDGAYVLYTHHAQQEATLQIGWLRVVDEAMVCSHLGIADPSDSYEVAKDKFNRLVCWHVDVEKMMREEAAQPAGQLRGEPAIMSQAVYDQMRKDLDVARHSLGLMKHRAMVAHWVVNDLRVAHPELPEVRDDGVLHEAIHDILRVDTPNAVSAPCCDPRTTQQASHPTCKEDLQVAEEPKDWQKACPDYPSCPNLSCPCEPRSEQAVGDGVSQVRKELIAFEAWAVKEGFDVKRHNKGHGKHINSEVDAMWTGWLVRSDIGAPRPAVTTAGDGATYSDPLRMGWALLYGDRCEGWTNDSMQVVKWIKSKLKVAPMAFCDYASGGSATGSQQTALASRPVEAAQGGVPEGWIVVKEHAWDHEDGGRPTLAYLWPCEFGCRVFASFEQAKAFILESQLPLGWVALKLAVAPEVDRG